MVKRAHLVQRKGSSLQYRHAREASAGLVGMRIVTNGVVSRKRIRATEEGSPRPGNQAGDDPQDAAVLLQGKARRMGVVDSDTGEVVVMRAFLPAIKSSAVLRFVRRRCGGDFCALARRLRAIHGPLARLNRDSVALPEKPGETVLIGPQANRFNKTLYGRRVLPSKAFQQLAKSLADRRFYTGLVAAIEKDTLALVGAKDLEVNASAVVRLGDAHCLGESETLSLFGQTEIVVDAAFAPHRDKDCVKGSFTSVLAVYEGGGSVQGGSQTFPERGVVMTMPNGTLAAGRYGSELHAVTPAGTPDCSARVAVVCFINRNAVEGAVRDDRDRKRTKRA
jgi:hypothetical protein